MPLFWAVLLRKLFLQKRHLIAHETRKFSTRKIKHRTIGLHPSDQADIHTMIRWCYLILINVVQQHIFGGAWNHRKEWIRSSNSETEKKKGAKMRGNNSVIWKCCSQKKSNLKFKREFLPLMCIGHLILWICVCTFSLCARSSLPGWYAEGWKLTNTVKSAYASTNQKLAADVVRTCLDSPIENYRDFVFR